MALQYTFAHGCGHTAIGPLIARSILPPHSKAESHTQQPELSQVTTIQLPLPFECPFCTQRDQESTPTSASSNTVSLRDVAPGSGILCVLEPALHSASHFNIWSWKIIKPCLFSELTSQDLAQGNGISRRGGTTFNQVAWIPKPCGEVHVIGGEEVVRRDGIIQVGVITQVSSVWRQGIGESGEVGSEVKNRFAGMLSQLHAAVLSGERAGRYD